jgi:hypothetical protein
VDRAASSFRKAAEKALVLKFYTGCVHLSNGTQGSSEAARRRFVQPVIPRRPAFRTIVSQSSYSLAIGRPRSPFLLRSHNVLDELSPGRYLDP